MKLRDRVSLSLFALILAAAAARAEGKVVLVAGGGAHEEGPAKSVKLAGPFAVDFDGAGHMYIAEMTGGRLLKVDAAGMLTRLGGKLNTKGGDGDGGPASEATFNGMHHLAVGPDNLVYIADTWNNRVRRVDPRSGRVEAFAGSGKKGDAADGAPAKDAAFGGIYCLAFDPKGERLILTDLDARRIRSVDLKTGVVTTVAGNGKKGKPDDGAVAKDAPLVDPRAACADVHGNVYILERSGNALRVVDKDGKIRTVAGTGEKGHTGGDALKASFNGPKHLCMDRDGGVLIADTENHMIRKYLPLEKRVIRVAGTGKKGHAGVGGPPLEAELAQPHGVYVHPSGALYISDSSNDRVVKVERGTP